MPKEGPFVVGLKTKEQNRRLELFRKVFGELVEDMNYLDRGFKQLRSIVDGDSFLESDFKWDSGKHRKVKSTTKQINDAWQKLENTRWACQMDPALAFLALLLDLASLRLHRMD